ncbi:MAG TPA: hypothetical protein VLE44_01055, partial [Candidatus Saccharimonadales bacterium]|nr:hypothetical protein [Candidatus Saccharimonadales bacterium]
VSSVGLIPNPSQREKTKRIIVRKLNALIAGRRYVLSIKLIAMKPRDRRTEVATNFLLLDKMGILF